MELEKTKEIAIKAIDNNVNPETAMSLKKTFMPFFEQAEVWAEKAKEIKVTDSTQLDIMKNARDIRLNIRSIRINVEKTRVDLKAESLRKGKAIDGIANVIKYLIVPIEEHLQMQEDFLVIQLEKRKTELKETREKELEKYENFNTAYYNLAEMPDANYQQLLENSKANLQLKKDADRKAEDNRIEKEKMEAEERERNRKENEKLKKEAAERERSAKIEREKRVKLEAELKTRDRAAERLLENETAKALAESNAKAKAEREAQLVPDKEKLIQFANEIILLKLPTVKNELAKDIVLYAVKHLTEINIFIIQECQKL